ncbi:unnamed protein product, partial [marine sediment metagenome]
LNVGDTYGGGSGGYYPHKGELGASKSYIKTNGAGMPKCLCMIPERLAWSLIQDGWILRNKIIWYKPNGMPSSVKDRFSNKWEYVFLFSKSQKYYFDLDAVKEPLKQVSIERSFRGVDKGNKYSGEVYGGNQPKHTMNMPRERVPMGLRPENQEGQKNPGDHWTIPTCPFPEAHFAVFPERLVEIPIKAGSKEDDIILDPFAGAGTTLYVAKQMRRRYIGIDIKQEYADMINTRLAQGVL